MATQQQIDANRKNSRKSTGPRTPQGKARSAKNSLKHGLTADHSYLADENESPFRELQRVFKNHF